MKICKNKIDIAMANCCISISELAEQSKVSRSSIGRFINGKTEPKPVTVGKIAKALNCKVEDIIEDTAATVSKNA